LKSLEILQGTLRNQGKNSCVVLLQENRTGNLAEYRGNSFNDMSPFLDMISIEFTKLDFVKLNGFFFLINLVGLIEFQGRLMLSV
jgi:hypothetical protein